MIVTCYRCPRQIACNGGKRALERIARLFGWSINLAGGGYLCSSCGGQHDL